METPPNHPLLRVTADDVKFTRTQFDVDDVKRINDSLDALEDWMKKQDHLVEVHGYLSRDFLERIFLLARGSLEGVKQKIDKLFTIRGMMPELCLNKSISEFDKLLNIVRFVALPKLCPTDKSRVMITQYTTDKLDDFSVISYFRYIAMIGEYRMHYDYSLGDRFVVDFKNVKHLSIISKFSPLLMKKCEVLCTEGFGTKIKGIHLLNAPSFIDTLVRVLKTVFKEKVAGRLYVHNSYEDLQSHIPKEILPMDYGGDEVSCAKLAELWHDLLRTEEAAKIISISNKLVTDETKRTTWTFNKELLGIQGSFRTLDVD